MELNPIPLIELAVAILSPLLDRLAKSNIPSAVLRGFETAIAELVAHKDDLVTKANLEAQRG